MLQENTAVLETSREGKFSLTFEIHHVSWNQTIHLSVRIRTLLIVLLSQVNAVRILPSYIFKVHINIILLCSKVCLPFIFLHQTPLCIYFPCTPRPPTPSLCQSRRHWYDYRNNIWRGYKSRGSSLRSFWILLISWPLKSKTCYWHLIVEREKCQQN